ncbi:10651_t:CDS:2 [Funneliformis geosporum]|nr:10651_t:CDS:2 [Funneliformis geosporum]
MKQASLAELPNIRFVNTTFEKGKNIPDIFNYVERITIFNGSKFRSKLGARLYGNRRE